MSSNQNKFRIITVVLPTIIFFISLTQDAFIYEYQGVQTYSAITIFLMGGTAILGGGVLEWFTWLANPIAIVACVRFLKETNPVIRIEPVLKTIIPNPKPISHWLSLLATLIAWSFSLWKEILAAESGTTGQIYSFEAGYWLWASSITTLCICINLYNFSIRREV